MSNAEHADPPPEKTEEQDRGAPRPRSKPEESAPPKAPPPPQPEEADIDESSLESFPASDPPSFTPTQI